MLKKKKQILKNEEEIFKDELEKKSIKSFDSFSSYSENSQHQIIKMNKKIEELAAKINNKENKNKKELKITFSNEESNSYNLDIKIGESDKFSLIEDKLYEEFPRLEEIGIKKCIYKGQRIKRNNYIKDLELDEFSTIDIKF